MGWEHPPSDSLTISSAREVPITWFGACRILQRDCEGKSRGTRIKTETIGFSCVHYPFRPICQYGCLGTPSSYPKWYAEPAGAASKRKNIDDDCNFGRRNLEMRSEIAPEKAMKDVLQRNPALFPTRLRIRTVTPSDASPRFLGLCGLRRRGCISGP